MKICKLKQILWYICVIACTVIANLALHYQKEPTDKRAVEKQHMENYLKAYLHITDDSIDDVQVDENRLMIALMYFNYNNRYDMYLTKEEALQEYNNFCTGLGSYDRIMALSFCCWYEDTDFTEDLQNELECLETSGRDFDWSTLDEVDSEKLSEICHNILEQPDILQQANKERNMMRIR